VVFILLDYIEELFAEQDLFGRRRMCQFVEDECNIVTKQKMEEHHVSDGN
jgi:hypothetical protein